jgi:5'-nucleotidase (lipoprotein e(P4) family)
MTRRFGAACFVLVCSTVVAAQQAIPVRETGIMYMRDSEEYAALARQTYRLAGDAVARAAAGVSTGWSVVLDVDETALDNTTYQLERAAYDLPFEAASWNAWVARRQAGAVPGAVAFVTAVRQAGGRVAWITNRDASLMEATRANLISTGLWNDQDLLCGQKTSGHTKAQRRREVVSGAGDCSWAGAPRRVLAFVGDQIGDFPDASEHIPETGSDAAFGRTCFLLPNSMYGAWTTRPTRVW